MSSRSTFANELGEGTAIGILILSALILVVLAFLLVKAVNIIVRVFAKYPKNKVLWITLILTLSSWVLAGVVSVASGGTNPQSQQDVVVAALSMATVFFLLLVGVCRSVEMFYSHTVVPQRQRLLASMLKPWWTPAL